MEETKKEVKSHIKGYKTDKKVFSTYLADKGFFEDGGNKKYLEQFKGEEIRIPSDKPKMKKEDKKFLKKNYFRGWYLDKEYKQRIGNKTIVDQEKNFDVYSKWGRSFIPLFVLVGVIAAIIVASILLSSGWFDRTAQKGHWAGKSEEQIQADLNAEVRDGEMNVQIANTVYFYHGSENEGIAHIENIAANHLDQKVVIRLDGSDEILYESGAIAPDYCINTIKLNKRLEPGTYKAIATFYGYDHNTHQKKGSVAAMFNIVVEED